MTTILPLRARAALFALLSAFGTGSLSAPALDAQSPVAFPADVYALRRERLALMVPGAAIIVPGRHLVGAHELPKQDPDFWYLTGVESPYAILVIAPADRVGRGDNALRTVLFLPDSFQFAGAQFPHADSAFRRATWNRPRRRLTADADGLAATGVTEVFPVREFRQRIGGILRTTSTVYLPSTPEPLYAPPGLTEPRTVEAQVVRSIAAVLGARAQRDVSPLIHRMRRVKDADEIAMLATAARISAESMVPLMRAVRPGMNDLEAAGLLEYEWKRRGAHRNAFAPIIGSGPNSMSFFTVMGEQYAAVNRTMRAGELLFVDYGAAEYAMYGSDICRTLPVSGRFTPEQRKYYDIVLEAQDSAISHVRPGVTMLEVIRAAAEVFRNHGLEDFEDPALMGVDRVWGVMPSPTHYLTRDRGITPYTRYGAGVRDIGHHVGLDATDGRDWTGKLEAGMVVTIEPKLYIPEKQIAIMIEDMILVTPEGRTNLSAAAPRRADDIERTMAVAQVDPAIQAVLTDYIGLYTKETLPQWRGLFLPSFTATFTAADSSVTSLGFEDFYRRQENYFATGRPIREELENVRAEREGRLASVRADFVLYDGDTRRRGRLRLLLIQEKGQFRIQALTFSYQLE